MSKVFKYNGKVINIVRKMLKLSYVGISARMGVSVSHYNAIITGGRLIECSKRSTREAYNALYAEAMALPDGERIFETMCLMAGLDLNGDN